MNAVYSTLVTCGALCSLVSAEAVVADVQWAPVSSVSLQAVIHEIHGPSAADTDAIPKYVARHWTDDPMVREAGGSWSLEFGPPPGGLGVGSSVHALLLYQSLVVAAGDFWHAGELSALRIAAFDGVTWQPLGGGLDGRVFALAEFDGSLVAAGSFASADGVPASNIAAWDGTVWRGLGNGLPGETYALAVFQGRLFAGGAFGIRQWDGSTWLWVGTGVEGNGLVAALEVHDDSLAVGGYFSRAGGQGPNLASWTGSNWSAIGGGVSHFVSALKSQGDSLWVGGGFFQVIRADGEALSSPYLALWRSSTEAWAAEPIGGAHPNAPVWALETFGSALAVGGKFTSLGPLAVSHLAILDGGAWSSPGSGMGGAVHQPNVLALCAVDADLYAGGWFTHAGGVPSQYIARWDGASRTSTDARALIADSRDGVRLFPNPSRGSVRLEAPGVAGKGAFEIFDVRGRLVLKLPANAAADGRVFATWDGNASGGAPAGPGVYFVRSPGAGGPVANLVLLK